MYTPEGTKQWVVTGYEGFNSLELKDAAPLHELDSTYVLVKLGGMSLNYRDLMIPQGTYPFPLSDSIVPGSDGAGTVIAVGSLVRRFKPGDKVITILNQGHFGGPLDSVAIQTGLGSVIDGTFRQYGAFSEQGLVHMPKGLSFIEAATLSCAGVTAWNALNGLAGRQVKPGDWILTQGTGGVSCFALQLAKAAGGRVIATTSSKAKAEILRRLGADHIIDYTEIPAWGEKAKELTGGRGCDYVVEVGGPSTMEQSLNSVAVDGVISMVGAVGGLNTVKEPSFLNIWTKGCVVRGILVGSRLQMEEMCRAVEGNLDQLRPVIDPKIFSFEELTQAYEYQWAGRHVGKVCIQIN